LEAASAHPEFGGADAMNALISIYWHPCYHYVRFRFQHRHEAAEDLVQGFFTALLEQQLLSRYDAARGPFRSYLRACLDRFACKRHGYDTRVKRGGGQKTVPLESEDVAAGAASPEEIFYREWQRSMFSLAIEDLRQLCERTGKQLRFRIFAAYDLADLSHDARPGYEQLARSHSLPIATVTNHLAWARRELRRLLELRVATVTPGENERRREVRLLLGGHPS
jgi:RNA polymerase sigma factor (sigma-70 family)